MQRGLFNSRCVRSRNHVLPSSCAQDPEVRLSAIHARGLHRDIMKGELFYLFVGRLRMRGLNKAGDAGKRSTKFVADDGEKIVLHALLF